MKRYRSIGMAVHGRKEVLDRSVEGLYSEQGARAIISQISRMRDVTKLNLRFNELCDEGCISLFKFLCSPSGKNYRISDIILDSNSIGDGGLKAIAEYLENNTHLKELSLQNNAFTGAPSVVQNFTNAINSSCLKICSLSSNDSLGDDFIEIFMTSLNSSCLRDLRLSIMGLTPRACPHMVSYISSQRCKLDALSCNANSLGLRSVRLITGAISMHNYSLRRVEVYANNLSEAAGHEDNGDTWEACEKDLRFVMLRNNHLRRLVETQATQLLRYARIFLCKPIKTRLIPSYPGQCPVSCSSGHSSEKLTVVSQNIKDKFPFLSLPVELQLHVLSYLAHTLSSTQLNRIYTYATSPYTLPPLFPFFKGNLFDSVKSAEPFKTGFGAKEEWLEALGCSIYEP